MILQPVTVVWAALVLATAFAWWSSSGGAVPAVEATAIVMILAAVKARLVILHFMDLKGAPRSWRLLFEGWVVLTTLVILGGYWYALPEAAAHGRARTISPARVLYRPVRTANVIDGATSLVEKPEPVFGGR